MTDSAARIKLLRGVSIAEASSYLLLLVAAVVKRMGGTELGVEMIGPLHGILFIAFALLVVRDHRVLGWSLWRMVGALILGSLPFGGFWVERRWLPRPTRAGLGPRPPARFHG